MLAAALTFNCRLDTLIIFRCSRCQAPTRAYLERRAAPSTAERHSRKVEIRPMRPQATLRESNSPGIGSEHHDRPLHTTLFFTTSTAHHRSKERAPAALRQIH